MISRVCAAMLVAGVIVAGCGGKVVVDSAPSGADSAEQICTDGGGVWEDDGCNGTGDMCKAVICLTAIAKGCHCAGSACWDGAQCVAPEM
jgi:hypothetical protein